eukprot:327781-Hanusia_phi.AAC.1
MRSVISRSLNASITRSIASPPRRNSSTCSPSATRQASCSSLPSSLLCLASHPMHRQVGSMVGDAILGVVVSPDAFRSISRADE